MTQSIRWFSELGMADLEQVGGKNASLGEMVSNLSALGVAALAAGGLTGGTMGSDENLGWTAPTVTVVAPKDGATVERGDLLAIAVTTTDATSTTIT